MKEPILDDINFEKQEQERFRIQQEIKRRQKTDYYGQVLIVALASSLTFRVLMQVTTTSVESTSIIINAIIVVLYILALVISQTNKLGAYIMGLSIYLIPKFSNLFFYGFLFLSDILWGLVIVCAFVIFIRDANKLRNLKLKLEMV